jgi:NTE family protein
MDDSQMISFDKHSLYEAEYIPGQIDDSHVDFICLSGGGVAGLSFVGVIEELERRGLHHPKNTSTDSPKIHYWLGSSAGAICASLATLGMGSKTMKEEIVQVDLKKFFDVGGRSPSSSWWSRIQEYRIGIAEMIGRWGAARGDEFTRWFRQKMVDLDWDPEITLYELYRATGQHLIVTTTSLNTYETLYLSRSSYPNMKVVDAVRASIIYPFVFQPIIMRDPALSYGHRILVDGGLLDNFPLNACDVLSSSGQILGFNRKAIGFTIMNNGKWVPDYVEITNVFKYAVTCMQSMHKKIHIIQSQQPYYWDRVASIETYGVSGTDFGASQEKLDKLVQSGKDTASAFFDQREKMIQEQGPLPRNLFIPNPRLKITHLSDDHIENTRIYQTNPTNTPHQMD